MGTVHSQVRYDVGFPPTDADAGIGHSSLEHGNYGHNYSDVNAILAYSQLPTELQEVEDADAAAQVAAGVIIADDGEQEDGYDFDGLDEFDAASIGAGTNNSGYESESGSIAEG
ncbi:hypothetical protein, partial [Acinetobacter baumannii]|uniref:hypothetical protein n=1 Tax=Acinetobacter baumannii TaxID=470 RepID=UPI00131D571A